MPLTEQMALAILPGIRTPQAKFATIGTEQQTCDPAVL
jgi:hypothetical protein